MKDVSPDNLFKRLEELFVCGVPGILQVSGARRTKNLWFIFYDPVYFRIL